jgi:hypothetical protein
MCFATVHEIADVNAPVIGRELAFFCAPNLMAERCCARRCPADKLGRVAVACLRLLDDVADSRLREYLADRHRVHVADDVQQLVASLLDLSFGCPMSLYSQLRRAIVSALGLLRW